MHISHQASSAWQLVVMVHVASGMLLADGSKLKLKSRMRVESVGWGGEATPWGPQPGTAAQRKAGSPAGPISTNSVHAGVALGPRHTCFRFSKGIVRLVDCTKSICACRGRGGDDGGSWWRRLQCLCGGPIATMR